jgi:hypothetical protein
VIWLTVFGRFNDQYIFEEWSGALSAETLHIWEKTMANIPSVEITIVTGDDDLRSDSSATAYMLVSHGGDVREYSAILKNEPDPSWGNNSTHGPIVWNLPHGLTDKHIKRFGIRLQSHNNAFETDDNWNINSVLVTYPDGSGGQEVLIQAAGVPLFRLTADQPQWETTEIG